MSMLVLLRTRLGPRSEGWLVAALLLVVTGACFLLRERLSITSLAMLYLLAVVFVSYSASLGAATACALASVLLLNFFFVPPRFAFRVEADENVMALVGMLAVALVITRRGIALRRETELARLNEARARQLQELAAQTAGLSSLQEVASVGERFLQDAFGPACRVTLADEPPAAPPDSELRSLPLLADSHVEGVAHVPAGAVADRRNLQHAEAICMLIGQALWRLELAASAREAEDRLRRDRAQSSFLATISHDFRTPLAAMVTAASSLQTQRDKLGAEEQQRLAGIILDEADHLATLTENTLQLARLENAGEIQRDWQSMEEIVGSVLARVRQRDAGGRIQSRVPAQLPLIQADPVLIAQLLENLLDNALKYSEGGVELEVTHAGSTMEVAVLDRGKSIAPDREETLFEPYRRSDRSGQRGAGLGLAVGRAIARAHGGDLRLHHRDGGGSILVLRLPVQQLQPAAEAA